MRPIGTLLVLPNLDCIKAPSLLHFYVTSSLPWAFPTSPQTVSRIIHSPENVVSIPACRDLPACQPVLSTHAVHFHAGDPMAAHVRFLHHRCWLPQRGQVRHSQFSPSRRRTSGSLSLRLVWLLTKLRQTDLSVPRPPVASCQSDHYMVFTFLNTRTNQLSLAFPHPGLPVVIGSPSRG